MGGVRRIACFLVLAAGVAPATAQAQDRLTMAVAYFDNNTGDEAFQPLAKGLADMLITDLSVAKELTLVEREKLEALTKEVKLGATAWVDPKTAQKIGKLLGADLLLTGSMTGVEPTLRLDARIVEVESGQVMATAKATGPSAEFFQVEAALVQQLLETFGVTLSPVQKLRVKKAPTKSFEAWKHFSEALDLTDKGQEKKARELLKKALQADPTYQRAQARLTELEARVAALEKRTDAVERAGGLILKPSTAEDHWSNYMHHLERNAMGEAIASLQGVLKLRPDALDALWKYAEHVHKTAGAAPTPKAVRAFAPKVAEDEVTAFGAIVAGDPAAALKATERLVGGKATVRAKWLRRLALGPATNATPTAEERAEELEWLHDLAVPAARAELADAFIGRATREAAVKALEARLDYYKAKIAGHGLRRQYLVSPPIAFSFKNSRTFQVRIAEPSPKDARVVLSDGREVPLKWEGAGKLAAEAAIYGAGLHKKGEAPPGGLQEVTVEYVDGKGRAVATKMAVWFPPRTRIADNSWRRQALGVYDERDDRPASLLVDAVAGVWTEARGHNYHHAKWSAGVEVGPWASGEGLYYRSPKLAQTGYTRPLVLRYSDGDYGAIGRIQYYWQKRTTDRKGAWQVNAETLANDFGVDSIPWHAYPDRHLLQLVFAGDLKRAVDLYVGLMLQGTTERGWRAHLHGPGGDYFYAMMLAAARGAGHRYDDVRRGAAFLPATSDDAAWIQVLVRHLDGDLAFDGLWAAATAEDNTKRDYAWRFRSEAAAIAALANPDWHKSKLLAEAVESALPYVGLSTYEHPILTRLLRDRRRAGPGQVKAGGRIVDRYEVTAEEFTACARAGKCQAPAAATCQRARGDADRFSFDDMVGSACWALEDNPYPMTWATKRQAQDYCSWRGGRLPTRAEWLKIASTSQEPTGSSPGQNLMDGTRCHLYQAKTPPKVCEDAEAALFERYRFDGYLGIAPVGMYPAGASPEGVEDLRGNVREWVADGDLMAAGCSYDDVPGLISGESCAELVRPVEVRASGHVGFRCVYDRAPKTSAVAQAKREGAPKVGRGKPSVAWARVPAVEIMRGEQEEDKVEVEVAKASKADLERLADGVPGLDKRALSDFVGALKKQKITGSLTRFAVREVAARAAHRRMTLKQAFDKILGWMVPPKDEDAGKAIQQEADELLVLSAYHSGTYQSFAHKLKKKADELTDAERRQAMFARLMTYGGSDRGMERRMVPAPQWGRLSWLLSKPTVASCATQPLGPCTDFTGINRRTLTDGGFVRKEAVAVPAFQLMKTEVTQAQYAKVTGKRPAFERCDKCAVTQVTYDEATEFCKAVGGRLPTVDEWEAAARGGVAADRYGRLEAIAWTSLDGRDAQPEVGGRKANRYGLHDMLGGVWEWTETPDKHNNSHDKIVRGGSWAGDWRLATAWQRAVVNRRQANDFIGFRCAK